MEWRAVLSVSESRWLKSDGLRPSYTPIISVYDLARTTAISNYSGTSGTWLVGYNWINGTIPAGQTPGNYYIKAVDGEVGSTVAVTDTYLTVTSAVYNSKM